LISSISYIALNELAGSRVTDATKAVSLENFRTRMFYYSLTKVGITIFGLLLVFFGFSEPTHNFNTNGNPKPVFQQAKSYLGDICYLLFVFGPLISAGLLEASNNHIYWVLGAFKFTYVD